MLPLKRFLKIGNWNVARPTGATRQRRILDSLAGKQFDVLVLTETHDSLNSGYPFLISSSEGRDGFESTPGHRWVTICSPHPLTRIHTTDSKRTAAALVSPPDASPFVIYGTVLPWIGSAWEGHPAIDGQAFAAALEVQKQDWLRIRKDLPDHELFLAGDFNQDLVTPRYYGSARNRQQLEDVITAAGLKALTGGASDPVRKASPPCACIDHICGLDNSDWNVIELERWPDSATPDKRISDHFGIGLTLTRANF